MDVVIDEQLSCWAADMVGMLSFQKLRVYQLADQLLRAAQSQPRNIAEGAGRCTKVDQVRFSMHARGSANEDDVTNTSSKAGVHVHVHVNVNVHVM